VQAQQSQQRWQRCRCSTSKLGRKDGSASKGGSTSKGGSARKFGSATATGLASQARQGHVPPSICLRHSESTNKGMPPPPPQHKNVNNPPENHPYCVRGEMASQSDKTSQGSPPFLEFTSASMPLNPTHKYVGPPLGRPPIAWSKITEVPVGNVSPSGNSVASQSSGMSAQSDQQSAYKKVRFNSVLPQVSAVSAHKEVSLDSILPQVSGRLQDHARDGVAPQSSGVSAQSNQQSAYKKVRFDSVLPQISCVSAHKAVSLNSISPEISGESQDQASDGRVPQSSGGLVLPQVSGGLQNYPHYKGVPLTSTVLSSTPLQKESLPAQAKAYTVHGGRDDSILSAKLIRIAPETSSF
jgi:hypothetical protein